MTALHARSPGPAAVDPAGSARDASLLPPRAARALAFALAAIVLLGVARTVPRSPSPPPSH